MYFLVQLIIFFIVDSFNPSHLSLLAFSVPYIIVVAVALVGFAAVSVIVAVESSIVACNNEVLRGIGELLCLIIMKKNKNHEVSEVNQLDVYYILIGNRDGFDIFY